MRRRRCNRCRPSRLVFDPLRVAIETQFAIGSSTGIGVFARGLVAALRGRQDVDVVELVDPRFDLWRFGRRLYWDQLRAPALARRARADVFHFTGGTLPWRGPHPAVLTLHDVFWRHRAVRPRAHIRWYFDEFQPRLARRAEIIATDTASMRAEVIEALAIDPARVVVAGAAVDAAYFEVERMPSAAPFALSVGTVEERKDLVTAVKAVARLPGLRLVSVGPLTSYAAEVVRVARTLGIERRIELRGYVAEAALRDLYKRAAVLVSASRYEGFGLPPLQALAAGLPVVAVRTPVSEEVLAECARLPAAGDDADFSRCIDAVLRCEGSDPRIAAGRERARRYTWANVAQKMMEIYNVLR